MLSSWIPASKEFSYKRLLIFFFTNYEIIILADDGSDEELQKVLAMSTNEFDCFSAEDFKEGLGKLDDTMIRYVLLRKLVFF